MQPHEPAVVYAESNGFVLLHPVIEENNNVSLTHLNAFGIARGCWGRRLRPAFCRLRAQERGARVDGHGDDQTSWWHCTTTAAAATVIEYMHPRSTFTLHVCTHSSRPFFILPLGDVVRHDKIKR